MTDNTMQQTCNSSQREENGVPASKCNHTDEAIIEAVDKLEIRDIVSRSERGWRDFDSVVATQDYADEATFMNSFGGFCRGKDAIRHQLTTLFAEPGCRSRTTSPATVDIYFVTREFAIVFTYSETTGQCHPDGSAMAVRRTNEHRIMHKRDGRWQIVSHIAADELPRQPGRLERPL